MAWFYSATLAWNCSAVDTPFAPDKLPAGWRGILRSWLSGDVLADVVEGAESETLQFVEGALIYRLPWAMEAIRVRALANGDVIGFENFQMDDFELNPAVAAVETGTMNRSASVLIQAGFNSRLAAIQAAVVTEATFTTLAEMRAWLRTVPITELSATVDWPTAQTHAMWSEFVLSFAPPKGRTWSRRTYRANVTWRIGLMPPPLSPLHLANRDLDSAVFAPDGGLIGILGHVLNPARRGLVRAEVHHEPNKIAVTYFGPDDLWLS